MDLKKEIKRPYENGSAVSAEQFGMNCSLPDNYEALSKALDYCRENNVNKLIIPKGTYYFRTQKPIAMKGLNNFILEGSCAEFIYDKTGQFFTIEQCSQICIRNLYVDWDWNKGGRLASVIKVKQVVREKDGYVDFESLEEEELDLSQYWITTNAMDPDTLTPGCEDGQEYGVYKNDTDTFIRKERIAPKTYRCYRDLSNCDPRYYPAGSIHLVRHYLYNGSIFVIKDTSHITMENITIYSGAGFGYHVSGHTHHLFMDRCNIILRPNSNRRITTTADGFHVSQSNGYLLFENCDFGFHGDDCINIHDNIVMYVEKESEKSLSVSRRFVVKPGDKIEFRNYDFSPMDIFNTVKDVSADPETNRVRITFEDNLPENLQSNCILFNHAFNSANYHIKDCYFHETRARGILAQASNGIIENCRFYRTQGAAIQIETGASRAWSEGMGVDGLIIRNNEFVMCDVNDWNKGVIYMSTYLPEGVPPVAHGSENPLILPIPWEAFYRTAYPIFKNIKITGNIFKEYPRRAMVLTSFQNIEITGNTFINTLSRKKNYPERGSIWVELGKDAVFTNNDYQRSPYMSEQFIEVDPNTTENIKIIGNE